MTMATPTSYRPRTLSIVLVSAVLVLLLVGVLLLRQETMPPVAVVRSPHLRADWPTLDLNTLKAAAINAQIGALLDGTTEREEIVLLTLGQWLTLTAGDVSFAFPQPRWTPLYVLTRYGSYHTTGAPDAPPFAALRLVLSASSGEVLEVLTFTDAADVPPVDALVEDDNTINPAVPTAPRQYEPGSA